MGNKSPHPPAILIAMAVRKCNMKHIAQCSMSTCWKPLDATIKQLLSGYCPGSRQGDSKQNNNDKCTNFVRRFDGRIGITYVSCKSSYLVGNY